MSKEIRIRLGASACGQNVAEYLARAGHPITADCGGKGKCGKCRIRLASGVLFENPECTHLAKPDQDGYYYACRVYGACNAFVLLHAHEGDGLTDFAGSASAETADVPEEYLGIALDIGTTTLAAALTDTRNGSVLSTASALNPQAAFGADVISRIEAVMRRHEALGQMQSALLCKIREMMDQLLAGKNAASMAVAGNPTMLHIFAGVSPTGMGAYPFTPAFVESKAFTGEQFKLPVQSITLLPSISAFVGGDITAGMLHVKLTDSERPALLIDVGTNGESVLFTGKSRQGLLYATSAAAGPAMEGAGISTGMGGISGAVCAFSMQSGRPIFSTVGDAPAKGICGSGLIDLVSALYQADIMDETGAFEDGDQFVYAVRQDGTPLALTQADIRAFQLSKSAIRASLDALCARAGVLPDDLAHVYLAGGLGHYMNVESAVAIGLLPKEFKKCTQSVGNASLGGCMRVLTDPTQMDALGADAARTQTLELSTDAVWSQSFMENMMFPEKDEI